MRALREEVGTADRLHGVPPQIPSKITASSLLLPAIPAERGCQLSIHTHQDARRLTGALKWNGVIADFRSPDVIRVAPVPMYNTFDEVWRFVQILNSIH